MISYDVVDLSRLQFGLTALYHFLFVPLTLGLSVLLGIMETVYVITNKPIWRDMTKFWGLLFGINFAMGVATGITMEFQFGTNWAYYSHYVGDIFGVPLAIEGMMNKHRSCNITCANCVNKFGLSYWVKYYCCKIKYFHAHCVDIKDSANWMLHPTIRN